MDGALYVGTMGTDARRCEGAGVHVNVSAPYIDGDAEYPSPNWPYFDDKSTQSSGWDAREALERVKAYNARYADGN